MRITYTIQRVITAVFLVVFAFFVIISVFHSVYPARQFTEITDACVAIFMLVFFLGLGWLARRQTIINFLSSKFFLFIFFAISLVMALFVSLSIAIPPDASGWDPLSLYEAAVNINSHTNLYANNLAYFQAYPNNLLLLFLTIGILSISSFFHADPAISLPVVTVLALQASFVLSYISARRMWGKASALVVLALGLLFLTFSLWSATFYSDTVGALAVSLLLFFITIYHPEATKAKTILYVIILGFLVAIAYLVKPTTIFIVLAACATALLAYIAKPGKGHLLMIARIGLPTLAIAGIIIALIPNLLLAKLDINNQAMPLSNFALIGLSKECENGECRYGAWNMADALQQGNFTNMHDFKQYISKTITTRLHNYGPLGYAHFLVDKGAWIVGDGTFYAYHEGTRGSPPPIFKGNISQIIRSFMHPLGKYYDATINILQTAWIMMLILGLCGSVVALLRPRLSVTLIQLSLIGLLCFLLVFEARSRYLYLYIGPVILLAAYGYRELVRLLAKIMQRYSKVKML